MRRIAFSGEIIAVFVSIDRGSVVNSWPYIMKIVCDVVVYVFIHTDVYLIAVGVAVWTSSMADLCPTRYCQVYTDRIAECDDSVHSRLTHSLNGSATIAEAIPAISA